MRGGWVRPVVRQCCIAMACLFVCLIGVVSHYCCLCATKVCTRTPLISIFEKTFFFWLKSTWSRKCRHNIFNEQKHLHFWNLQSHFIAAKMEWNNYLNMSFALVHIGILSVGWIWCTKNPWISDGNITASIKYVSYCTNESHYNRQ